MRQRAVCGCGIPCSFEQLNEVAAARHCWRIPCAPELSRTCKLSLSVCAEGCLLCQWSVGVCVCVRADCFSLMFHTCRPVSSVLVWTGAHGELAYWKQLPQCSFARQSCASVER
eukprot:19500-Heterococcus_DN1.PRE.2